MIRRDQPQRPNVAGYMARQLVSELPNQRTHAMLALTKLLHFVKLRTTCGASGEDLLLQKTSNPLKHKTELPHPLPADFTDKFIASFSEPIGKDTKLSDKASTGWLVWGDSVELYDVPPEDGSVFEWDESSTEALALLRDIIIQPAWWETFIAHLAMEKTVDVRLFSQCRFRLPHSSELTSTRLRLAVPRRRRVHGGQVDLPGV